MSEAMMQLELRKESIDPGRVGLFSGIYAMVVDLDVKALEDAVSKFVLAQALIDNIANTEGGLSCRECIVYLDLVDSLGNLITASDWRQPVLSDTNTSFTNHAYNTNTGSYTNKVQIYSTNAAIVRNDRKIYCAWGLRQVGSGPARDHQVLVTTAWIWKRSDVKTIDQWMIQSLETIDGQAIYAQTPILYKRNDDMAVWVIPNARTTVGSWKFDQLMVLMKIAESLGTTAMG